MKVIILAGGVGSRLSEITKKIPKPLVKIGKKPVIHHIMDIYSKFGYNDFIICTGYKSEMFIKYFKSHFKFKILSKNKNLISLYLNKKKQKVSLVYTGKNTQTGGRLLKLKKILNNEKKFFLTYGDGVGDINISRLLKFHNKKNKIATVTAVQPPPRFGAMILSKEIVLKFKEKFDNHNSWINGGFFVFDNKIFKHIKNFQSSLEGDVLEIISKKKLLNAYKHKNFWHPMDTLRDKIKLSKLWNSGKATWK